MIGTIINKRYQIESLIGSGGMANVFLASDLINKNQVAIKIIKKEVAEDLNNVMRFKREAEAISTLSHNNIVKVYNVGEVDGLPFIVMEYVKSKSLKELLNERGTFSLKESIDVVLQLLKALGHAHQFNIIHRDVKPQNILIQADNSIKLGDFGIALIGTNNKRVTSKEETIGSVHYMAPEGWNNSNIGTYSDIYSLGITFYELLIGSCPFNGIKNVEIALKHLKEPIPDLTKLNRDIPKQVNKIINKALAKKINKRYLTCHQFEKSLLKFSKKYDRRLKG